MISREGESQIGNSVKRKTLVTGKPVNEENIKEVIKTRTPGMPAFRHTLSDQEINDVVEFLKTKGSSPLQ